jgi:Ca2+/Na+ antiporter
MANAAAKKLLKQNQKTLKFLIMMVLGFSALSILHLGYQIVFGALGFWDYAGFLLLVGANVFCYWSLSGHAKPTFDDATGELVSPGEDLGQKGLMEYYWDVLYINWFVQLTTIISNWFWLVYLAIPVFGTYKIWTSIVWPLLQARSASKEDEGELVPKEKRRRERAERRRTKVVRG